MSFGEGLQKMELFSVSEMYKADRLAIEGGVPGLHLMEAAGAGVVDAIKVRWEKRDVCVLVGPGNNGGDGFVVARLLKQAGWPVTIYMDGAKTDLSGDAALNAKRWRNKVQPLEAALERIAALNHPDDLLVVDALFGAGLSRPLEGTAKILAELITVSQSQGGAPVVVSVDVPSGLNGDSGRTLGGKRGGICFHADLTVTFCRLKPAHALMPGRGVCGEVLVVDIGISEDVVAQIGAKAYLNTPELWGEAFPEYSADIHKYARGHLVALGGEAMTGAARLVSAAARRAGAGLVSIAVPEHVFPIYAASVDPGTLTPVFKGTKGFQALLADTRKNTCVIGPGAGRNKTTRAITLAAIKAEKRCVLDADALSVFADDPKTLFKAIKSQDKFGEKRVESIVLTPHGGEFARLFPDLAKRYARGKATKLDVCRAAAKRAGCVVLLKGADTTIATPRGRVAVSTNAPPWLATAGSGDVLAGIIGALLAQGMPGFEAANAGAWLHGEAANAFGPGLIAEDCIDELPAVLEWLLEQLD